MLVAGGVDTLLGHDDIFRKRVWPTSFGPPRHLALRSAHTPNPAIGATIENPMPRLSLDHA
jgi:hypothetical protein